MGRSFIWGSTIFVNLHPVHEFTEQLIHIQIPAIDMLTATVGDVVWFAIAELIGQISKNNPPESLCIAVYTPICFETAHAVTRRRARTDSLELWKRDTRWTRESVAR